MKPVSVQVITYAPTIFSHCQHCELAFQEMGMGERLRRREGAEALPDDLIGEFQVVSDWVHGLLERHGPRVRVEVLDAASIRGFIASLRHRIGRYPAVVVDGRDTWTGFEFGAPDAAIDRMVAAARVPPVSAARSSITEGRGLPGSGHESPARTPPQTGA